MSRACARVAALHRARSSSQCAGPECGRSPTLNRHHARFRQVLDMIEHGYAKRGINLTTLPARLLYRSAYVVLISFVACTIPFFGVRGAVPAGLRRACTDLGRPCRHVCTAE